MTDEPPGDEAPRDEPVGSGDEHAGTSAEESRRLQCQFCGSYAVGRMFLASTGVDSCECQACGARWEEERASGRYLGRGGSHSVITNRPR